MSITDLLVTVEGSFVAGGAAGFVIGTLLPRFRFGCPTLLVIPVARYFFVGWWQDQNPDLLRSTSGLQFIFGPIWPGMGAIAGYPVGKELRSLFDKGS